jgi:hypothetical protein
MKSKLIYVELKTGYNDDGPAWIGKGFFSKTGRSIYFNGLSFAKGSRSGGNHYEVLSGNYYWISGIKKKANDRHWAGHGKVKIDKNVVEDYLEITKFSVLPKSHYEIIELNNNPPIQSLNEFQNLKFI